MTERIWTISRPPLPLSSAPTLLATVADGARVLARTIAALTMSDGAASYDYCLLRICKPSLDSAAPPSTLRQRQTGAAGAGGTPEEYAVAGISDLLGTVRQVQRSYNPTLEVLGVLLTRCDRRRSSVQQVRDDLIAALGDKVFDTMIPYLTEASNAPRERRSCVSKPGSEIGRAYMAVAKEVLVRLVVGTRFVGALFPRSYAYLRGMSK